MQAIRILPEPTIPVKQHEEQLQLVQQQASGAPSMPNHRDQATQCAAKRENLNPNPKP